ncbi:hypothetical protein EPI10_032671 [Gossypium australe]|uniref:Uncharacterized protein n=1 Tax=Gossypium australe TaxID=47621 RepID=A0A5B6X471_9ROSI|nr:hypothetical protein EPI10_032671 [Gossypium australe]
MVEIVTAMLARFTQTIIKFYALDMTLLPLSPSVPLPPKPGQQRHHQSDKRSWTPFSSFHQIEISIQNHETKVSVVIVDSIVADDVQIDLLILLGCYW